MTTFLAIAENSGLRFTSFTSDASGKLEKKEGKYMITEITLSPVVTIPDEQQREKAEKIIKKSDAACLISNSVKSTILVRPQVVVAAQ